jgi:RNA polymerase sigma-70 factor (ECF subfamily)
MVTFARRWARIDIVITGDEEILAALKRGDERAFIELVERHQALMLRVARRYVRSPAVAEDVVQETWLGVLNGLHRFEGRASLKTWIFQILSNRARTRGVRERRSAPFSALAAAEDADDAILDADRFLPEGHRWVGHWAAAPTDWPEERVLGDEAMQCVREAIEQLPPRQAHVLVLRDVEGWDSEEVCAALGLTDGNQRILLHRARGRVRAALEQYLGEGAPS